MILFSTKFYIWQHFHYRAKNHYTTWPKLSSVLVTGKKRARPNYSMAKSEVVFNEYRWIFTSAFYLLPICRLWLICSCTWLSLTWVSEWLLVGGKFSFYLKSLYNFRLLGCLFYCHFREHFQETCLRTPSQTSSFIIAGYVAFALLASSLSSSSSSSSTQGHEKSSCSNKQELFYCLYIE